MTQKRKPIPKTQKEISNDLIKPYDKTYGNPNDSSNLDPKSRSNQLTSKGDTDKPFSVGIQDIDESIFYYFQNVIKPIVSQNGTQIPVPIIYGSPERWKAVQRDGYYRDKDDKIMAPLIMFKRNTIEKNYSIGNKLDANNPNNYAVFVSKWSGRNSYDNFNVLNNRAPQKTYHAVVIPDYITLTYSCVIYTYYIEQMNKIVESINYASEAYWGDPQRFKFRARIDSFATNTTLNQGEERLVRTEFSLKLYGYIIPDTINKSLNSLNKFPDKTKFIFSLETSQTLEDAETSPKTKSGAGGNRINTNARFLDQTPLGAFQGNADLDNVLTSGSFTNPNLKLYKGDNTIISIDLRTLIPYTSSYALNAAYTNTSSVSISSSYASTASYALNSTPPFPYSGSAVITGSLLVSGSSTFTNMGPAIFSGSTVIKDDLQITGSDYTNSAIRFISGAVITTSGPNLDMTAGPGGWSELGSNNSENYVWVDDEYIRLATNWQSGAHVWIIDRAGNITGSGNINMDGYSVTASLYGTSSWAENVVSSSYALTASYVLNAGSSTTGSFTGSFTGSLYGTSSWANNSISASYASTASYVLNAVSSSFSTTASYTLNAISSSYSSTSSYAIFAETASYAASTTQTNTIVLNQSGNSIAKGVVVRITGSNNSSDIPRVVTASYINDNNSANTLGITTQTIANGSQGLVITEGVLTGIDTSNFISGQLIYLGATGSIIGTAPVAPLHAVRLGEVIRQQQNNGSIYVRIDNGYELEELHDVLITGSVSGDLLVRSGSVWINSKQLTGSYGLTGSLTISGSFTTNDGISVQTITASFISASSFTGSLFGTSSYSLNAQGSAGDIQFRGATAGTLASSSLSGYFTWLETNNNAGNKRSGSLNIGPPVPNGQSLSNNPLSISHNINDYAQMNMQNLNSGNAASSDIIATADNGSDTTNYVDLGINSSTYNQAAYNIGGANDSYLVNVGGNLTIGTDSANDLILHTNGSTKSNERIRITSTGVTRITGSVIASGSSHTLIGNVTITGSFTTNDGVNVQTVTASFVSASSITGSLFGTSSWSNNAVTASYVLNAVSSSFASTASYVTGSIHNSTNPALSSSYAATASYILNAVSSSFASTASYILQAVSASFASTASYVTGSIHNSTNPALSSSYAVTASYITGSIHNSTNPALSSSYATTASYVLNAVSASFASTASYVNTLNQNVTVTGSILATGSHLMTGIARLIDFKVAQQVINNTTTATQTFNTGMFSNTWTAFAPNSLNYGDIITVRAKGNSSQDATAMQINAIFALTSSAGTVTIMQSEANATTAIAMNRQTWIYEGTFYILTTGSSGTLNGSGTLFNHQSSNSATQIKGVDSVMPVTFNSTIPQTMSLTMQMSVASSSKTINVTTLELYKTSMINPTL